MERTLEFLTGKGLDLAASERSRIAGIALAERAASGRAFGSVGGYAEDLGRRTVCLTLLAGAGTRWKASIRAAASAAAAEPGTGAAEPGRPAGRALDPERPRGLYPVPDFLRPGSASLPIAAYAIAATRGLGRRVIVVRGWEREIDEELLLPLGVDPAERAFFEQAAPFGSPLGHGDAAWQCRALWKDADYVIANFGGDANSRLTVLSSLLAIDALRASGSGVDLLVPAARFESPAYPVRIDEEGLPRGFGHGKLKGGGGRPGPGYANVGVRIYAASALLEKLESIRARFWVEGEGYAIPGNDPAGREFALDNVDDELAAEGRARILASASPDELCPVKSLDDIPAFAAAIERVVASDRAAVPE